MNEETHAGDIRPAAIDELRRLIKILRALDLQVAVVETIKEHLKLMFRGYVLSTPALPIGQLLYRGVLWENKPTNMSQLTHPAAGRVSKFQRANRPGQPMFYCAVGRSAPFFELAMQPGQHIALSEWRTTRKLWVGNAGYHDDVFRTLQSNRETQTWGSGDHPSRHSESNKLMHKFYALEFTKKVPAGQDYLYKLSVAIAEQFLDGKVYLPEATQFDGIIYPAVNMRANTDNIVLRPEAVRDGLSIHSVEFIRVKEKTGELKYEIEVLDFANSFGINGEIEWKGRAGRWQLNPGESAKFIVENGQWVMKDNHGKLIDKQ